MTGPADYKAIVSEKSIARNEAQTENLGMFGSDLA
jgi:hypothetical protein